jgi:secondary thiamine-phosphate synthase enzyme
MLKTISVKTSAQTEMVDVTSQVQSELSKSGIEEGRLTLYVPHTTAAITINEGADPAVKSDILMVLNQMVPWKANYKHMEGNSPAHVKTRFDGPRNRKLHLQIAALKEGE